MVPSPMSLEKGSVNVRGDSVLIVALFSRFSHGTSWSP